MRHAGRKFKQADKHASRKAQLWHDPWDDAGHLSHARAGVYVECARCLAGRPAVLDLKNDKSRISTAHTFMFIIQYRIYQAVLQHMHFML